MRQAPSSTNISTSVSMTEATVLSSQRLAGPGWSTSSAPRPSKKRRDSRIIYHGSHSRRSPARHVSTLSQKLVSSAGAYAFDTLSLRPTVQMQPQRQMEQSFHSNNTHCDQRPQEAMFAMNPTAHQGDRSGPPWQSSMISYGMASGTIPQFLDESAAPLPQNAFYVNVTNDAGASWAELPANAANMNIDLAVNPGMEIPYGSFGSLESLSGSTPTSPESDGYVFPLMASTFDSTPAVTQLCELDLSDEYFQIGQSFYPASCQPDASTFYHDAFFNENSGMQIPVDLDFTSGFDANEHQWLIVNANGAESSYSSPPNPAFPWPSEGLPAAQTRSAPISEMVPFEATAGTFPVTRKEYHEPVGRNNEYVRNVPATPLIDSDNESWGIPFDVNFTPQHSSPSSLRSAGSSPRLFDVEYHGGHVFGSFAGITKPKISKGRTRGLTQLEKRQAREVRDAKACWACHISKVKCSPCFPGSPCEQCTRLIGKRRFCRFECFNDPLESLYVFLVPNYLHGHFTLQDVESFVTRNTKSWGKRRFRVQLSWGYRKCIEADVVALELKSEMSEMAFHQTTESSDTTQKTLVQRHSVPLGIPLDAMDGLEETYAKYVRDIAQGDLSLYYDRAAYFRQDSKLAKRLLKIVCEFYTAGLNAGSECEPLRDAIEVHITSGILEKSLVLDKESENVLPAHMRRSYPGKAVARCVQRQIKLALFLNQQKRIFGILKNWGVMMWKINNTTDSDNAWAISYSVLLLLTLVMDKISAASYFICEDNIRYYGAEPTSERAKFLQLVRLIEVQLFDRCKEIFHWKFKTRKGGKEACNPIRDGLEAFRGRPVSDALANLTYGLQGAVRDFGKEIRSHTTLSRQQMMYLGFSPYTDLGRLACILLDDSLDH